MYNLEETSDSSNDLPPATHMGSQLPAPGSGPGITPIMVGNEECFIKDLLKGPCI